MLKKPFKDKHYQTLEQVEKHYQIEKALADKLKNASREERKHLYTTVYDELYQSLPNNSIALRKSNPQASAWVVSQRMQLLKDFLKPDITFLEIGPGDCSLAIEVAQHTQKVYAVDVTKEFKGDLCFPANFELVISDGSSVPVAPNSIDIVYSHQVMEHLHPDDALQQLSQIYEALVPGGSYICITPNRLSGPHDVSWHFDAIATGLHLKEYTVTELYDLFHQVGFSTISYCKSYKDKHFVSRLSSASRLLFKGLEGLVGLLPYPLRRDVASLPLLFRGMTIIATK